MKKNLMEYYVMNEAIKGKSAYRGDNTISMGVLLHITIRNLFIQVYYNSCAMDLQILPQVNEKGSIGNSLRSGVIILLFELGSLFTIRSR